MVSTTAHLTGFGIATPARVDQETLWEDFFARHFSGARAAGRVFRSSTVRRRHAAVNPLVEDVSTWSTEARMRRYAREAPPLGASAVAAALADSGLAAEDVGLFAVASCTGYTTPGLDIRVTTDLGMPPDVQRLLIGHMGCYAAIPGLGAVADFVVARRKAAVLLCLELTSLHLQPATGSLDQAVAHSLFSDAAAAVVVRPEPTRGALAIVDIAALTDPAGADHMTWNVTNLGFRMGLSPRVPDVLSRHVGPMITGLLARHGLTPADVDAWAVHPGGPRILEAVGDGLALPDAALAQSRHVLAEHGNCSSATVFLVLEALRCGGRPRAGRYGVAMAFGPGLTLYAALVQAT
ncbi:type III polyketide synthase [Saccharomonospora cyanea]|uniref:Putative naringenin-chalcone synthase n=1 Tax=Saccharomonospora cyanea NA-134 TaxID=882082 RepID=H5XMQ9_9PSEU|nr:type III polyketide synthase [Saccharomonospora cyanea]EHR61038.1 putative naringenin-chalcone synthase [Saccharomonospora cyanea NA-134]